MKTKKTSNNNKKSRIIFFAIALTYNLLLGLYLKDFLVPLVKENLYVICFDASLRRKWR